MRLGCSRCGKDVSTEVPEGTLVRAWIECPECIQKEPNWEKEFEDEVCCLDDLFEVGDKYLFSGKHLYTKLKIKCKDGCIQIERIK